MTIANFSMSPTTRLVFGVDRVEKLGADVTGIAGAGASVLLVADPGLPAIAERIEGILKKAGHKVGSAGRAGGWGGSQGAHARRRLRGGGRRRVDHGCLEVRGGDRPQRYAGRPL